MENLTTCSAPKPRTGIEGLDAYRVAVEFYRLLRQSTRARRGHVIDQSYRAAEWKSLNIAEAYPMPGAIALAGSALLAPRRLSATPGWSCWKSEVS